MRLSCSVPGCRRTRGQRKGEPPILATERWVCGDHWRAVPRVMRAIVARARRRANRLGTYPAHRAFWRLWERCERAAIEAAVGI